MTTLPILNNYISYRRSTENVPGWRHTKVVGILQQQTLFNVHSNQLQFSAFNSFSEQLQNNQGKIISIEDIISSFSKMLHVLLEINASAIYTQITSVNSLVIKAETRNGNIYAEMFFDEITGWISETVLNIFHNQQLQFNNSGQFDAMILAIKDYFGSEETDYTTILNQGTAYNLSGTALTTIDF